MARPKKLKKKDIEELNNFNNSIENQDKSPFVPQDSKLKEPLHLRIRNDLTEKQKGLITLIKDKNTKIVFVDGPAGSSKTFCAVQAGLELLNEKRHSAILYIRTAIESSSRSLGALPGLADEKIEPYLIPLYDKISEFLDKGSIEKLKTENRIQGNVVNFLRGNSFNAKCIILDESQNYSFKELETAMTRLGKFSTMIIIGDRRQSDINNSGFKQMYDIFNNALSQENGIFCLEFTKDDIVRSGVTKFIVETLDNYKLYSTQK